MPHSSTSDPSPRRRYSIVDRLGCFCLREPGSLSPVIFVTFESLLPPIPSNSIFFSFFGRKGAKGGRKSRQDNNTTTWNSNSQSHFSYGTRFLFPSVPLFQPLSHPFIRFFPISLSESQSEKVSTFISLKLLFEIRCCCKVVPPVPRMQRMNATLETANNFSAGMAAYIPFS